MNAAERVALRDEARESGALAELPELQRQAVELWLDDVGYKRLSIMLGVGRDTARGRVERGIARLKRQALQQF